MKLMKLMFLIFPMTLFYICVYEIQMEYPEDLQNKHNEFPFLPENICTPSSKTKKSICNLNHKGM